MLRLFIVCLLFSKLYGQNQRNLVWDATAFDAIRLELPYANTVIVSTTSTQEIALQYLSEGEYQNHLVLRSKQQGPILELKEQQAPSFKNYHDKLSAHKVWASQLQLLLPQRLSLQLDAQIAQLIIKGNLSQLSLMLNEGSITITGTRIKGDIKTLRADVALNGQTLSTHAISQYGERSGTFHPLEQSELKIESVEGNISLLSARK